MFQGGPTQPEEEIQSCQTQKPPWATAVLPMGETAAILLRGSVGGCALLTH